MKRLLVLVVGLVMGSSMFGGVMMQGFFWNPPGGGHWWNTLRTNAGRLRNMVGSPAVGINRIWFPPVSKGHGHPGHSSNSMGYDPYDYYDLGQFNQLGTTETRFGSQAELRAAIAEYRRLGVDVMADIIPNHRSGGASEWNPWVGSNTWTDFRGVASGMMRWTNADFHPNNLRTADEGRFGGFADVSHVVPRVSNDLRIWMNWLRNTNNAGFQSWRYDFVKGFGPWVVNYLNAQTAPTFSVAELWDGNTTTLNNWANAGNTSMFDFALYYTLRDIVNNSTGGGHLPNVFDPARSFAARNPMRAVTFVANHDTDEMVRDKMMAYAFILTYQGYPCIFWRDFFDFGLADGGGAGTRGWGNGIRQLVWVRNRLDDGAPNIELLRTSDGDTIIYGSRGPSTNRPGYIVIINDHPTQWRGFQVQTGNTFLRGRTLRAYAWSSSVSGQNVAPQDQWCDANGFVTVWAAPRGYAVYAPVGF